MPALLFYKPLSVGLYAYCLLSATLALATEDPKEPAKDASPANRWDGRLSWDAERSLLGASCKFAAGPLAAMQTDRLRHAMPWR